MLFGLSNGAPVPWHKMHEAEFMRRTAKDFATHLLPHIKPHYRILDIGCGPGSITLDLARLVPDGFVRGIDINAGK
jgi:ubiquinone/menaquinone biosynthesis C-methylase UbiE